MNKTSTVSLNIPRSKHSIIFFENLFDRAKSGIWARILICLMSDLVRHKRGSKDIVSWVSLKIPGALFLSVFFFNEISFESPQNVLEMYLEFISKEIENYSFFIFFTQVQVNWYEFLFKNT